MKLLRTRLSGGRGDLPRRRSETASTAKESAAATTESGCSPLDAARGWARVMGEGETRRGTRKERRLFVDGVVAAGLTRIRAHLTPIVVSEYVSRLLSYIPSICIPRASSPSFHKKTYRICRPVLEHASMHRTLVATEPLRTSARLRRKLTATGAGESRYATSRLSHPAPSTRVCSYSSPRPRRSLRTMACNHGCSRPAAVAGDLIRHR